MSIEHGELDIEGSNMHGSGGSSSSSSRRGSSSSRERVCRRPALLSKFTRNTTARVAFEYENQYFLKVLCW